METSIKILVVETKSNVHLAAFFLTFRSLDSATRALKSSMPILLNQALTMQVEQLTFPFDLNGVKMEMSK